MVTRFVRTSVSVALSAAFLFAAPVLAEPEVQSTIVRTADLDLTSDAGVKMLERRVSHAAKFVCGNPNSLDLPAVQATNNCRRVAIDDATPRVQFVVAQARQGKTYVVADAGLIHLSRR